MPPKKGPKLTKKQIQEQKKEAARLQKIKEQEQAEQQRQRLAQEARVQQVQRQKMLEVQRLRIVQQKQKKYPQLEARMKSQNQAYQKLLQQQRWKHFTTPYFKNYSIQGTNLSTFINEIKTQQHVTPKDTLKLCEQSEIFITKLEEKILECRTEYKQKQQMFCKQKIIELQKQQMNKLQLIMIQYALAAEGMEDRNIEQTKKKNQANVGQKPSKTIDSVYQMTQNFKIGMYIHTFSTKNVNKFAPIGIKEFGFNSDMPPKWTGNTAIVKFQWTNFNDYAKDKKTDFRIVGGVYNIQFYDMAPQTKQVSNITIKKHYKGKDVLKNFKLQPAVIKQAFKIMYQIPKYIFLTPYTKSTLKMAQFDLATSTWNILPNENIMQFMQHQKRVICKVSRPQPVAFVQYICADYPYVAWQLRTVEPGKVLLDFQLKRGLPNANQESTPLMLQFQIGPNIMKLDMGKKYPEFADLQEDYCTPETMLNQLSKRGIHILPTDEDYEFAGLKVKDRQAEKNAIRDIAYAVETFTVRSQPNDSQNIQVKIRENLDYQNIFLEDQEKDWKKIRWGDRDKCWIDNNPNAKQRHMNLEVLLEQHDICEKECVEKMKYDKSFLLRKTIMKVLELTRVLAFTTNDPDVKTSLVEVLKNRIIVQ